MSCNMRNDGSMEGKKPSWRGIALCAAVCGRARARACVCARACSVPLADTGGFKCV